jgi:hypothetical protein
LFGAVFFRFQMVGRFHAHGFFFARRFFGSRIFTTPPGPITTLLRATRTSTVFDLDCFRLLIARTLPN